MIAWFSVLLALLLAAPEGDGIHRSMHVRVPMKDGVRTCASIYQPAAGGRFPTVLIRTPYGKGTDLTPNYRAFVEHGYAVVVQDVRGRYHSEGRFDPLFQEPGDGEATLNWIARQPWSNGQIGMIGGSYLGIVQWKAALTGNPHLKAIFPVVSGYDDYRDRFYSTGGAMKLGQRLLWISDNLGAPGYRKPDFNVFVRYLPLSAADRLATGTASDLYQAAIAHPAYDAFWKQISTREQIDKVRIPVYAAGGWFDNFVQSDLEAFSARRAAGRVHHLVVGPWPHNMSIPFPDVHFGPHAALPIRKLQFEWFDEFLRGRRPSLSRPPLQIFVMGRNEWRDEQEWPLRRARPTPFYLHARSAANSVNGDGELRSGPLRRSPPDHFTYNPRDPVPTNGGSVCCNPKIFPWGPLDQRIVEQREDVLVYTSPVLDKEIEVTGPIRAVLYVSTSAPDTDFTAKLVDVFPDGHARLLTDGILRLRYRNSLEQPAGPAHPAEVYQINIDAGVTSNVFLDGHRIRLEIASSSFPRFDRNPNTGRPVATETELRIAQQTVYHDRERPSHVLLPVVP